MRKLYLALLVALPFTGFAQQTQKPVLHGKNWIAITGKPLAATAGAQIFSQGGNAVELLYREAIQYAEAQNKELLFDSKLTIPAYKSFKKLDGEEFTVIQNPAAVLVEDGKSWEARGSWVLRVERKNKE